MVSFHDHLGTLARHFQLENKLMEVYTRYRFELEGSFLVYHSPEITREIHQWATNIHHQTGIAFDLMPMDREGEFQASPQKYIRFDYDPHSLEPVRFSIMPERLFLLVNSHETLAWCLQWLLVLFSRAKPTGSSLAFPVCRLNHHPIVVVESDPEWSAEFKALRDVIWERVKGVALRIEHIGSTSVPGLAAKPVIDLIIILPTQESLGPLIRELQVLGYHHEGDKGIPGREAFGYDTADIPLTAPRRRWMVHHLYASVGGAPELEKLLFFRDYLRGHPDAVAEYSKLKLRLARKYRDDREGYTSAKTGFITSLLPF